MLSKHECFFYMPPAVFIEHALTFFSPPCILWISLSGNITFNRRLRTDNKEVFELSCSVSPVFVVANGTHHPPTFKDKLFISQIAYFALYIKQPIVSL